jgi:hypothetical protein
VRTRLWWSTLLPVVVALVLFVACDFQDDIDHKKKLESLVQRQATRADVALELGAGYTFYEKGTPSWADLESFLSREPQSALRPLRENVGKYPKIMFYTTAFRMTWISLDERDVIRTYYLAAQ